MPRGHAFLYAVIDWHSRMVLGWALSNTMEPGLCLEALDDALAQTAPTSPQDASGKATLEAA